MLSSIEVFGHDELIIRSEKMSRPLYDDIGSGKRNTGQAGQPEQLYFNITY